jgi:hypothetical protein
MVGKIYIAQTGYNENREDFYKKLYVRIKIGKISKRERM